MSTNDCPGANPANRDQLAMGAWAEHEDGSLIVVESTEGGRVIYSIFDMSKTPVIEYRDSMAESAFKKQFSWEPKDGKKKDRWTWRDKTPFEWDRIIKHGAMDGTRFAHADDLETAAERVRKSRELHRGTPVDESKISSRFERLGEKANKLIKKIQKAISDLPR
jgi:hypothetical protein